VADRAAVWEGASRVCYLGLPNTTLSQCPIVRQSDPGVWLPFDLVQGKFHLNVQTTAKCQDNP